MTGTFDIAEIDEVIHGRLRLGIMAYLSGCETADFSALKAALRTTDGNLSVHLRKLEDAGYVAISKNFEHRRPLTRVEMTAAGRQAYLTYLDAIEKLIVSHTKK